MQMHAYNIQTVRQNMIDGFLSFSPSRNAPVWAPWVCQYLVEGLRRPPSAACLQPVFFEGIVKSWDLRKQNCSFKPYSTAPKQDRLLQVVSSSRNMTLPLDYFYVSTRHDKTLHFLILAGSQSSGPSEWWSRHHWRWLGTCKWYPPGRMCGSD